jgi:hypothetical protein
MIEESLLKSNFIGRDGFRWWVGQIAPFELGSGQEEQSNGGGWGNRAKVRILGYHSFDDQELANDDLPWAQVLLPTTSGSGAANTASNTKLKPSDYVFGFFLDGDNAQIPVIIGVFGRSSEVSQETYSPTATPPFVPFTGYTGKIEKPNGTLAPDESNEQSSQSQKSPRDVPPNVITALNEQVNTINQQNISIAGAGSSTTKAAVARAEVSFYSAIGQKITLANTTKDTSVTGIISQVNGVFDKIGGIQSSFLNVDLEIERAVSSIQSMTNGIVSQMFSTLSKSMVPSLQEGLAKVYNTTSSSFEDESQGILAGVDAQKAFVEPVFGLQESMICSVGTVVNSLGDTIRDLLKSTLDNVDNFVSCAGTQFAGSLLNSIISKIEETVGPSIEGVSGLLEGGMSISETLTSSIDAISKVGSTPGCNQDTSKSAGLITEYIIGKGPAGTDDIESLLGSVLENAKLAAEIGRVGNDIFGADINGILDIGAGESSGIPECDVSMPTSFSAPEIRIFGGGGSGGSATAVLGGFVRDVPKVGENVEDAPITASIVGVKIDESGEGYKYPPFIEFIDSSKKGYGAVARTIIESNPSSPKYGKIKEVYMVSIGENYPIGDTKIDSTRVPITGPGGVVIDPNNLRYDPTTPTYRKTKTITVGIGSALNVGIASLVVVKPGIGYTGGILVDPYDEPIITGFGETVGIKIDSGGGVVGFISDSAIAIIADDYPEIRIRSLTGSGAEIRPSIGIVTSVSKLTQIIDCIS